MIDTSAWKEFRIGDLLIDESLCVYGHNKKWTENENPTDKSLPVISGITVNNGIYYYTDDIPNKDEVFEDCLTITTRGEYSGTLFYHKGKFVLANNILTLPFANTNELTSLFLKVSIEKLGYGGYDNYPRKEVLINDRIKLPATSDGQPDWEYMESYMKAVMEESEKSLENLKKADDTKHLIDVSGWGEFDVTKFFTVLSGRAKLSNADIDDGNTPVYSSNSTNGGVFGYTTKSPDYEVNDENPFYITFGDHTKAVNIVDRSFCVMDNVKVLTSNIRNYDVLHFIITSWLRNVPDLGYARHWSEAEKAKIWLPITSTGEPDWQYMEDYMRRIMDKSEQIISDLRIGAKL